MALSIGTNNSALQAAAAASSVNRSMETSMERLSTGKRINSASDDAAGVADHEGHLFRRRLRGGHDQVALVLAVGVIDEDDHATLLKVFDDLGDGGDGHIEAGPDDWLWPGR